MMDLITPELSSVLPVKNEPGCSGKTRCVLSGAGNRAHSWLQKMTDTYTDEVEIVGLCDVRIERARDMIRTYGLQAARAFDDFDEMLKHTSPDRVIVIVPERYHAGQIIRALDQGCEVATEKPLCVNLKQCEDILAAERRSGKPIFMGFNYRLIPLCSKVREIVLSGEIGRPVSADLTWYLDYHGHGASYFRRWHRLMAESGGLLLTKATHHFDLANWWMNDHPSRVFALGRRHFFGAGHNPYQGERCSTCEHQKVCDWFTPANVKEPDYEMLSQELGYRVRGVVGYPQKYACIEEVPAPRQVPVSIGDDFAWYADWCGFKTWAMSKYIGIIREMHEANGVRDVTFMTNFNPHRPEGVPTRMPDFEKATGPRGIAGYDFYRGAFMSYSGYQSMARVLKLMNATLRYTWSAEFMAGGWRKVLDARVSDDHMRFMALCALAQGCKALSWFMFHDRDCWNDAPVSSHGHERPSLAVLKTVKKLACETINGWDGLVPATDLAVIYDLTSHQHSYLGDPSPCNDNALYVGKPMVDCIPCGRASLEYEGLFRMVEHAGRQAAVIDPVHSSEKLTSAATPLAILPGSPVIHGVTAQALEKYVREGGKLVVSGTWPGRCHTGGSLEFLGGKPKESGEPLSVGKGTLWWVGEGLGGGQPEEDSLESITWLTALLDKETPAAKVRVTAIGEVTWIDWNTGKDMKSEGGHRVYRQPRNLFTAVLHEGPHDHILFVLNHYPEAARAKVALADASLSQLVNLDSGETLQLQSGAVELDLDRKSASVYRVL